MEEHNIYDTINEMFQYAKDNPGTSYYDIKLKAYTEESKDWITCLRNKDSRKTLSILLKELRKSTKIKYKNEQTEITYLATVAEINYFQKLTENQMDNLEESAERLHRI